MVVRWWRDALGEARRVLRRERVRDDGVDRVGALHALGGERAEEGELGGGGAGGAAATRREARTRGRRRAVTSRTVRATE